MIFVDPLEVSIPENTTVGSTAFSLEVIDTRKTNRPLEFAILSGNVNMEFIINSTTDEVVVNSELDRESSSSYLLTIIVVDVGSNPSSLQSASTQLFITIEDVNDNAPSFLQLEYSTEIDENTPFGFVIGSVSATDADIGSNSAVTFSLLHSDLFTVSTLSGEVSVIGDIDYEVTSNHTFLIQATDSGTPRLSSNATFTVTVRNLNDERPVFLSEQYNKSISELIDIGTTVLMVEGSDIDTPDDMLVYELLSDDSPFVVESSGALVTAALLDYEAIKLYTLEVSVSDGVSNTDPAATATISIYVRDENDNFPVFPFEEGVTSITIPEDINLFTSILNVTATDSDDGLNSQLTYSILNNTGEFIVTMEGDLQTVSNFDREVLSLYSIVIEAIDNGTPKLSSTLLVNVIVSDVNDNIPHFISVPLNVTVSESLPINSTILLLQATDADIGSNSELEYLISEDFPFAASSSTGTVTLIQLLDFESIESYKLTVTVKDNGFPSLNTSTVIDIYVTDYNDNPPKFSQPSYNALVSENAAIGAHVIQVSANDSDTGEHADIEYSIISSGTDKFSINETTGSIVVSGVLDFESKASYSLVVLANNSNSNIPLDSSVQVIVVLADENEFTPIFSQNHYQSSVTEEQNAGVLVTTVRATDADGGSAGDIEYSVSEDIPFLVLTNGSVITNDVIDREISATFTFTVIATDNGVPPHSSNSTVTIMVDDINDSPPVLFNTYSSTVAENSPIGTLITLLPALVANDADASGNNSIVRFSIAEEDNSVFFVEESTGEVTVSGLIDYEESDNIQFTILAQDNGNPSLSSSAVVTVIVTNENDEYPVINNLPSINTFTEGDNSLIIASDISISDEDQLPLQSITVSLVNADGADSNLPDSLSFSFTLDPSLTLVSKNNGRSLSVTGQIGLTEADSLLQSLSFNNMQDEPSSESRFLQIIIYDGVYTINNLTEIQIMRLNDNAPLLSLDTNDVNGNYYVTFTEEGLPVHLASDQLLIQDDDNLNNASFTLSANLTNGIDGIVEGLLYSISLPSGFTISFATNHSLVITGTGSYSEWEEVLGNIQYYNDQNEPDSTDNRTVLFSIFDGVFTGNVVKTTISIELVNDPPLLDLGGNTDYEVTFIEGRGLIRITDSNNFHLSDADDTVLQEATILLINPLDGDNERLLIDATDIVSVSSTNHSINITGPALVSQFAAILASTKYANDMVFPTFSIREVQFTVYDEQSTSMATTFITFSQVNNPPIVDLNGPEAGTNYSSTFYEDTDPIKVFSSSLTIHDIDSASLQNASISLFASRDSLEGLMLSESDSTFQIILTEPNTITITGSGSIEEYVSLLVNVMYYNNVKEPTVGERSVRVTVSDGEDESQPSYSHITVLSVNDLPLISLRISSDVYYEESSALTLFDGASIEDEDNTTLSVLTIRVEGLINGNLELLEYMDDNSLQVFENTPEENSVQYDFVLPMESNTLDDYEDFLASFTYKHLAPEPSPGIRTFFITLDDGADSSIEVQYFVNVSLINDNSPQFTNDAPIITGSVSENTVDVVFLTLSATDADLGVDGQIIFSIVSGNQEGYFDIHSSTGALTLVKPVDREIQPVFPLLTVIARNPTPLENDESFPTVAILVSVLDKNDQAPIWKGMPYNFVVTENDIPGAFVGNVSAVDNDIEGNAALLYSIIAGNVNNAFSINEITGTITISNSTVLDRESYLTFTLTILASDSELINTTSVFVTLLDVNDNEPAVEPSYITYIIEDSSIDSLVFLVPATDADSGVNGSLVFLLSNNSVFYINKSSGEIFLNALLDHELQNMYSLDVTVKDEGIPSLSSYTTITVVVLDVNDNFPIFDKPAYSGTVVEDTFIGQVILIVSATDLDTGNNSLITYSLDVELPFMINSATGEVSVSASLDREKQDIYYITIYAEDQGEPSLTGSTNVTIIIHDINDNLPQFSKNSYSVFVSENVSTPHIVLAVVAMDADIGDAGLVNYSIVLGNMENKFIIGSDGVIQVVDSLDYEVTTNYTLLVEAFDSGVPPLSSIAEVTITVSDVNDNSPMFTQDAYNLMILENQLPQVIETISAVDIDSEPNAMILYTIKSSSPIPFAVSAVTGVLSSTAILDREGIDIYSFIITATDSGIPSYDTSTEVTVLVTDINDNAPMFTVENYTVTLSEDYSIDVPFATIETKDVDIGTNAIVTYAIQDGNNVFAINSTTGSVSLHSNLDAETATVHTIIVQARDGGSPSLSSNTTILVYVTDVNDNAVFIDSPSPVIQFTEEGPSILIAPDIMVTDADIDSTIMEAVVLIENCSILLCEGHLAYNGNIELLPKASLTVSNDSQILTFTGAFNELEITDILQNITYSNLHDELIGDRSYIRINVTDGSFTTSTIITITFNLINDNPPVIDLDGGSISSNYSTVFIEGSSGVYVSFHPLITDNDSGETQLTNVQLSITDPSMEFLTATSVGDVTVFPSNGGPDIHLLGPAALDDFITVLSSVLYHSTHENPSDLERLIEVTASDGQLTSSSVYCMITIKPVNDPPSVLLSDKVNSSVSFIEESDPIPIVETNFEISDPDSIVLTNVSLYLTGIEDNGFEYLLAPTDTGDSIVAESTGLMVVLSGEASISDYISVVKDVLYLNNASEPIPGKRLVVVTVSDEEDSTQAFSIISVFNKNDPPSINIGAQEASFVEDGPPVQVLSGAVDITDADNVTLQSATLTLLNGENNLDEGLFVFSPPVDIIIEGNGSHIIQMIGPAEHHAFEIAIESVYYSNEASQPLLTSRMISLIVSDGVVTSSAIEIIVQFELINDIPVVLLNLDGANQGYIVFIEESNPESLVDSSASISDIDNTILSHMEVQISSVSDGELEEITYSNVTDELMVSVMIDHSSLTALYNFTFQQPQSLDIYTQLLQSLKYNNLASEPNNTLDRIVMITVNDFDQYSEPAIINITIALLNDNQPVFDPALYVFTITENSPVDLIVGSVFANDEDAGDLFQFEILDLDVPFEVEQDTGAIYVSRALDYEVNSQYNYSVSLTTIDAPITVYSSVATLLIIIEDVNEHPNFNQSKYEFSIWENSVVGTPIGYVVAEDKDSGQNGILLYMIAEGSDMVSINSSNGLLFAVGNIDYEQSPYVNLTVQASDGGNPPLVSEASVLISLIDDNDNIPYFSQSKYFVQTVEQIPNNTDIALVIAYDQDSGINAQITFTLESLDLPVEVGESTGVVYTTDKLIPGIFNITITATDGGMEPLSNTTLLIIDVLSTNETSPLFSQSLYEVTISENSTIGSYIITVSAIDPLTNLSLTYELSSAAFIIDSNTGIITSNVLLDRETQDTYDLQVLAVSQDGLRIGIAQVAVFISDVNDFPPVFSQMTYTYSIKENALLNIVVGHVYATDVNDEGNNAVIAQYVSTSSSFSVNNNGTLYTTMLLDRELVGEYIFTVTAIDDGLPALSGMATVIVTIIDINDNSPVFADVVVMASVIENQPPGTGVTNVTATDADEGVNAVVRYSLESPYFTVNSVTGDISTLVVLDYDSISNHQLTVLAIDQNQPLFNSSLQVIVNVIDVDDLAPVFNQSEYIAGIVEEQLPSVIVTVTAYDLDSQSNSLTYSIIGGDIYNHFTIDAQFGNISSAVLLDRESIAQYTLIVSAGSQNYVGDILSSTATIYIAVADINDNAPAFINTNFTISENADLGAFVGMIEVTDLDEGINAGIGNFSIIPPHDIFTIDPDSGVISVVNNETLDRELINLVHLYVSVHDLGIPQLATTAQVEITIIDVNDNAPVFVSSNNSTVSESTPIGEVVFTVKATDSDFEMNSEVLYSFVEPFTGPFVINSTTGDIMLSDELDYEIQVIYTVHVSAMDKGAVPQETTQVLTITVDDVDDVPPFFQPSMISASVIESAGIGTPVTVVTAQDADTVHVAPITYSILNDDVPFAINLLTGQVSISRSIDRETQDSYVLTVEANGFPAPPAVATITIEVTDVNDVTPYFTNTSYTYITSELADIGTALDTFVVQDDDLGISGLIAGFKIEPSNPFFIIDNSTSVLSISSSLDYELLQSHVFQVLVYDSGVPSLTGSTIVTINIRDENDNAPQFTANVTSLSINEDFVINDEIITLQASDIDSGDNGVVMYSLLSTDDLPIAINGTTGKIYTIGNVIPGFYGIVVKAIDHGQPELSSTLTLNVTVIDINEAPMFYETLYEAEVSEGQPINSLITIVNATDNDKGQLKYYLQKEDFFFINENTGEIFLAGILDHETQTVHTVVVYVNDSAEPPLSASTLLKVLVLDENDNSPVFEQDIYNVTISEDNQVESVVVNVNATDADGLNNGLVTYTMTVVVAENLGLFHINAITGVITVSSALDRETVSVVELVVTARDAGDIVLSSTAVVNIAIGDVDDNPPVFSLVSYEADIEENIMLNTLFFIVSATDADIESNAIINYRLLDMTSPFNIDSESGELTVVAPGLDRESIDFYSLVIEAYNPYSLLYTANTTILITVLDNNDNIPLFTPSDHYTFTASENVIPGTIIGSVTADDIDFGLNGSIVYHLQANNSTQFSIDEYSGEIINLEVLDYEEQENVTFEVLASDLGTPPLSSTALITVVLKNINDNAPLVDVFLDTLIFTENSQPITVGTSYIISDRDDLQLTSMTIQLLLKNMSDAPVEDTLSISLSPALPITISSSAHILNITGPGSIYEFTTVLHALQYSNVADEPMLSSRIVLVQVSDGIHLSNMAMVVIKLEPLNDNAPFIDLMPSADSDDISLNFLEDQNEALFLFPVNAIIGDNDVGNNTLESATITIANPLDGSHEILRVISIDLINVTSVNNSYIELEGLATLEQYKTVLDTLSYSNTAEQPSLVTRDISIIIYDGLFFSEPANVFVTIVPSNDAPVLLIPTQIVNYTENDMSVQLLSNFTLHDVDSSTLAYASLQILEYVTGSESFNYSTLGTNITVHMVGDTITFYGPASLSEFQDVLLTLSYINSNINDSLSGGLIGSKRVQIVVSDGQDVSKTNEVVVTFYGINDPPIIDLSGPNIPGLGNTRIFYENNGGLLVAGNAIITDVDSVLLQNASFVLSERFDGDDEFLHVSYESDLVNIVSDSVTGSVSILGLATTLHYQDILRSLTYNNSHYEPVIGTRSVEVQVTDSGGSTSSVIVSAINVFGVNDPPVLNLQNADIAFMEGGETVALLSNIDILDVDNTVLTFIQVTLTNTIDDDEGITGYSVNTHGLIVNRVTQASESVYTFTFTPKANGTIKQFEDLLSSLTYYNNALEPSDVVRIIEIIASDGVDESDVHVIEVSVLLINDNAPVYTDSDPVILEVFENSGIGALLHTVDTSDADKYSTIKYTLLDSNNPFAINDTSGTISLQASLDREEIPQYNISVVANDTIYTSVLELVINIIDINDEQPQFVEDNYMIDVLENTTVGSVVLTIVATDNDIGSNSVVEYHLTPLNSVFSINETTGELILSSHLDYESDITYNLTVVAVDLGFPNRLSSEALVYISVINVNDNPPVLDELFSLEVLENSTISDSLIMVQATDLDGDSISYSLADGLNLFHINETSGSIALVGPLDRESEDKHDIVVQATDGLFTSSTNITINVIDIDDNSPQFLADIYIGVVKENAEFGTSVLQLSWSDNDLGLNAAVMFNISSSVFGIADNGHVYVAGSIDREQYDSFEVEVFVLGVINPSHYNTTVINITVLDENDNNPQFGADQYMFTVSENVFDGVIIGNITATDADQGNNSLITYSLLNYTELFNLNDAGSLTVTGELDLEATHSDLYTVLIEAVDHGSPYLSAYTTLTILVVDENEFVPVFNTANASASIEENSPIDTTIFKFIAMDDDYIDNRITYSLPSNASELFSVDSITGELVSVTSFDFETNATNYNITIIATDDGSPPLSALTYIIVYIEDVNEYLPLFAVEEYMKDIPEDYAIGSIILSIKATDTDSGTAGVINYRIIDDALLPFNISVTTGELILSRHLDREEIDIFNFTVEAYNPFFDQSFSKIPVTIFITDVNDNNPIIDRSTLSTVISSNLAINAVVTTVYATDDDIGANAQLQFTLHNYTNMFNISNDGVVTVAGKLIEGLYLLLVTVEDGGDPQLKDNATMAISIIAPYTVSFSEEGAGFFNDIMSSTYREMTLFVDAPPGTMGQVTGELSGVSVTTTAFTSVFPEPVTVEGKINVSLS